MAPAAGCAGLDGDLLARVSTLERVETILRNPEIYALARLPPRASSGGGGPTHPDYILFLYEALISVRESACQVEAELAHPLL